MRDLRKEGMVRRGGGDTSRDEDDVNKMPLRMISLQTVDGAGGIDDGSPDSNGY